MKQLMVETVKNGCPLCGGEVKGNKNVKYYCKCCHMLFTRISKK